MLINNMEWMRELFCRNPVKMPIRKYQKCKNKTN